MGRNHGNHIIHFFGGLLVVGGMLAMIGRVALGFPDDASLVVAVILGSVSCDQGQCSWRR